MSVSHLIQRKDVRDVLDPIIPFYRRSQRAALKVPCLSGDPRLIGTAFDYALRFEIQRRCPHARHKAWVAEGSLRKIERRLAHMATTTIVEGVRFTLGLISSQMSTAQLERIGRRARRRVDNARTFLRKHLSRRRRDYSWMTRLAEHALRLARLDAIYRAGYFGDGLFAENTTAQRDELIALLEATPFDARLVDSEVLLNPTFGAYSKFVGGADADLVVGGRLIDLKVSMRDNVERSMVRQLVAYLILATRARRVGEPIPPITSLELYFARHNQLWTMRADGILTHPDYPAAEQRFLEIAAGVTGRALPIAPARREEA